MIVVEKGQSLMDIAVKHYGNIEGVFDLAQRNDLKGITDNIYEGDVLKTGPPLDVRVVDLLKPHQVATVTSEDRARGIGFWRIEKDLKVS